MAKKNEGYRLSSDKRRESIIETAIEILANKSFETLSMRSLAKEEGISESMLYRFFHNKYDVLLAIIKKQRKVIYHSFKDITEAIKVMIPDLEKSLPTIGELIVKKLTENQAFFRFITREGRKLPQIFHKMQEQSNIRENKKQDYFKEIIESLELQEVIRDYFERCYNAGNLRKDLKPTSCATIFLANFFPIVTNLPFFLFREIDKVSFIKNQIDIMLYGMVEK
jgi:AcrR family transcriptional regulator